MRAILTLIGLAAVVCAVLIATGMMSIETKPGSLPVVKLQGGEAPKVTAKMGQVELGTANATIEVPTVTTTNTTIAVPTLSVKKADPAPAPTDTE